MRLFVVLLEWGIFVYITYVVHMFPLVLMMLGFPWLIHLFVYNIPGRIGDNFVLLLFLICVLFLFVYSSQSRFVF
jgi:hypothetical protein